MASLGFTDSVIDENKLWDYAQCGVNEIKWLTGSVRDRNLLTFAVIIASVQFLKYDADSTLKRHILLFTVTDSKSYVDALIKSTHIAKKRVMASFQTVKRHRKHKQLVALRCSNLIIALQMHPPSHKNFRFDKRDRRQ